MDVWPNDILMTTIHAEAIWAWAHHSRKSFGMGCYGYLPTWDMMRMMAIAVGGKEELQKRPRFMAICSVVSPLQMDQAQAEGALICAEYGQPMTMSPEGIAGATAPVTLAGLLVQENAAILAHIALVQIFRPGTPVLYGTVSTVANMRYGTVALGSPETGLITAASAQLAKHYGLPIRSVGGATDAKRPDIQAGVERLGTLLPAALAGVNLITCAGTLDGTMMESNALLALDDEICDAVLRMGRGIEVNDRTMALDLIKNVGYDGNYLQEDHTAENFRSELFIPSLYSREPFETWQKAGEPMAMDHAREYVKKVLAEHEPYAMDAAIEKDLDAFRQSVAARSIEDFYLFEQEEKQDYENL
jgi:trimethylamine--corrinoid protein Co-methyltransferase